MLHKIVLECSYPGDEAASYNWGSLMHGALMEMLPEEAAEDLHESALHPYSQYIQPLPGNKLQWHIGIWDNIVSDLISRTILPLTEINLKSKNITLKVLSANRDIQSEQDFLSKFFNGNEPCRRYKLEFLTPCTHKSDGGYVLFPSEKFILQSLFMRFAAFSSEFSMDDDEVLAQIAQHTRIVHYSLRSAKYHFKGISLTGYTGRVTLSLHGPEQLARLTGMLLSFAEYAGVGIKTSLGMGGCRVVQEIKNSTRRSEEA